MSLGNTTEPLRKSQIQILSHNYVSTENSLSSSVSGIIQCLTHPLRRSKLASTLLFLMISLQKKKKKLEELLLNYTVSKSHLFYSSSTTQAHLSFTQPDLSFTFLPVTLPCSKNLGCFFLQIFVFFKLCVIVSQSFHQPQSLLGEERKKIKEILVGRIQGF